MKINRLKILRRENVLNEKQQQSKAMWFRIEGIVLDGQVPSLLGEINRPCQLNFFRRVGNVTLTYKSLLINVFRETNYINTHTSNNIYNKKFSCVSLVVRFLSFL